MKTKLSETFSFLANFYADRPGCKYLREVGTAVANFHGLINSFKLFLYIYFLIILAVCLTSGSLSLIKLFSELL